MGGKGGKGKGGKAPPVRGTDSPLIQIKPRRYISPRIPPYLHEVAPNWNNQRKPFVLNWCQGLFWYAPDWRDDWANNEYELLLSTLGVWKPDAENRALEASLVAAVAADPLFQDAFKSCTTRHFVAFNGGENMNGLTWNPTERCFTNGLNTRDSWQVTEDGNCTDGTRVYHRDGTIQLVCHDEGDGQESQDHCSTWSREPESLHESLLNVVKRARQALTPAKPQKHTESTAAELTQPIEPVGEELNSIQCPASRPHALNSLCAPSKQETEALSVLQDLVASLPSAADTEASALRLINNGSIHWMLHLLRTVGNLCNFCEPRWMLAPQMSELRTQAFRVGPRCSVAAYASVQLTLAKHQAQDELMQALDDLKIIRNFDPKTLYRLESSLQDLQTGFLRSCTAADATVDLRSSEQKVALLEQFKSAYKSILEPVVSLHSRTRLAGFRVLVHVDPYTSRGFSNYDGPNELSEEEISRAQGTLWDDHDFLDRGAWLVDGWGSMSRLSELIQGMLFEMDFSFQGEPTLAARPREFSAKACAIVLALVVHVQRSENPIPISILQILVTTMWDPTVRVPAMVSQANQAEEAYQAAAGGEN